MPEAPGSRGSSRRESFVTSPTPEIPSFEVSAPSSPGLTYSPPGSTQRSRSPSPDKDDAYEPVHQR